MNIGILKENVSIERRVALSPTGVEVLTTAGNQVFVLHQGASQTLLTDEEYRAAGAVISYNLEEIITRSDILLKISPPTPEELSLLNEGQVWFSFLHLATSQRKILEALFEKKVAAVAYELIENERNNLAILQVMSEIAGQLSIHIAAHYLQGKTGGRGVLLGSVPRVPPASIVIVGAGVVGKTAARLALDMGAEVTILDKEESRLDQLRYTLRGNLTTAIANTVNLTEATGRADVVIGSVLIKGEKAPHIITEEMVKKMKVGSVIVDVSIDQGGCVETSRPTTLDDPVFIRHGVLHYCVPNIPASVARTATIGLTYALLPYVMDVAKLGINEALKRNKGLARGLCTFNGWCTNLAIGKAFAFEARSVQQILLNTTQPVGD
ncbi:MAG: alanine dehydrogenase [Ignavibacteriales bacterium]|nr:alanine dehydrogenase [Ignavibacteriales bacterium]